MPKKACEDGISLSLYQGRKTGEEKGTHTPLAARTPLLFSLSPLLSTSHLSSAWVEQVLVSTTCCPPATRPTPPRLPSTPPTHPPYYYYYRLLTAAALWLWTER